MKDIIDAIAAKHQQQGITVNPPATAAEIAAFERTVGFVLPEDFSRLYTTCNGFECEEDLFNLSALADIMEYGRNDQPCSFIFAEYMINSDQWAMRLLNDGTYEIFNYSKPELVLTTDLEVFLHRFLLGNVFETDGLYDWQEQLKQRN